MQRKMEETPVIRFGSGDELVMNIRHEQFSLHDNAIGQLAEKMNISSQYLRELVRGDDWQKHLAATVLNERSSQTGRQRVLARELDDRCSQELHELSGIHPSKNYYFTDE